MTRPSDHRRNPYNVPLCPTPTPSPHALPPLLPGLDIYDHTNNTAGVKAAWSGLYLKLARRRRRGESHSPTFAVKE